MSVKDGKLILPSGMTYRMLVLPNSPFMTPSVARKLKELVLAGATILGPKPTQSPSLTGYPTCDVTVRTIADQLWGDSDKVAAVSHVYGKGRVVPNASVRFVLEGLLRVAPDFSFKPRTVGTKFVDIHRRIDGSDVYFVSNQRNRAAQASLTFRVSGKIPELWHPETGTTEEAPVFTESRGRTTLPLNFDSAESVFVVFRKPVPRTHLATLTLTTPGAEKTHKTSIVIDRARYESEDGRGGGCDHASSPIGERRRS